MPVPCNGQSARNSGVPPVAAVFQEDICTIKGLINMNVHDFGARY